MAAEIKAQFGMDVELIAGSGGVFDVLVDQQLLYSKWQSDNEFPAKGWVVEKLRELT